MLAAFLLVLREVMEAALVITIVMTATRGVAMRHLFVLGGVALGTIGALFIAGFTNVIADALDGAGQEIFNACVLLTATALLAWHVIWMASHGKKLASELRAAGEAVKLGLRPMSALSLIVASAVLREGAEIALFMEGLSFDTHGRDIAWGAMAGLVGGMLFGAALYFGMVRIPLRHLFSTTNGLLVAVAAGMAAKAANYLAAAGWLPELGARIWDTSRILPDDTFIGSTLGAFMGYTATPSGIQLLFFAATIAAITLLSQVVARQIQPKMIAAA